MSQADIMMGALLAGGGGGGSVDAYTKAETDALLSSKVDLAQGVENAGKFLASNSNGNVSNVNNPFTVAAKDALLNCFRNVAWESTSGEALIEALENALEIYSYVTIDDVASQKGITNLTFVNGTSSYGSITPFAILEFDESVKEIKCVKNTDINFVVNKNNDGSFEGFDEGMTEFKFTINGNKYSASRNTQETVTGSQSAISNGEFSIKLENSTMIVTQNGSEVLTVTPANRIAFWAQNVSGGRPISMKKKAAM